MRRRIAGDRVDILDEAARKGAHGVDDVIIKVKPGRADIKNERLPALIKRARIAREIAEMLSREVTDAGIKSDDFSPDTVERDDGVGVAMRSEAEARD